MADLSSTLCWFCAKAVPTKDKGCSWSRKLIPVEGWRADRREIRYDEKMMVSYFVHWCPEYEREARSYEQVPIGFN